MPSPDILIWGFIAILAILLWPIRNWIRRRYDRDDGDDRDDDLGGGVGGGATS